jgi:hypothetical protein
MIISNKRKIAVVAIGIIAIVALIFIFSESDISNNPEISNRLTAEEKKDLSGTLRTSEDSVKPLSESEKNRLESILKTD